MNYFSKNKKWMAYLILLTFLFTSIMPSNLGSMNSIAEAAQDTNAPTDALVFECDGNFMAVGESSNQKREARYLWLYEGEIYFASVSKSEHPLTNVVVNGVSIDLRTDNYWRTAGTLKVKQGAQVFVDSKHPDPPGGGNGTPVWDVVIIGGAELLASKQFTISSATASSAYGHNFTNNVITISNAVDFSFAKTYEDGTYDSNRHMPANFKLYIVDNDGQNYITTLSGPSNFEMKSLLPNQTYYLEEVAIGNDDASVYEPLAFYLRSVAELEIENSAISYVVREWQYKMDKPATDADWKSVPANGLTVNNIPKTVDIDVEKVWNDTNNQDGIRPLSVNVKLMANGAETEKTCVLYEENNWQYTFEELAKYDANGEKIVYTVVETSDVAGYNDPRNSGTAETGYTITNTHTPETIDISGEKKWVDADNQDGLRPSEITVNLLVGDDVVKTAKAKAENGWKYEFTDLPKYEAGKVKAEIQYTVKEANVPAGYTSEVDGLTITNTHTPATVNKTVTKVWDDADNQDGIRPASIEVELYANGTKVNTAPEVNKNGNSWTYTWSGLAQKANGVDIVYTTREANVPAGYTSEVDGLTITNTHAPATTEVAGTKIWQDNNNEVGKRPGAIIVRLYADGTEINSATVREDENGDWKYSFTGLPKYKTGEVGQEIVYTVTEDEVVGYTSAQNGNNFTNTLEQEWFEISGEKSWKDETGTTVAAGAEKVVIDLFRDGELYRTTETSADFNWEYSFGDIPRYAVTDVRNNEEVIESVTEGYAHKYDYRLVERPVDGYVPSYDVTTEKDGNVVINVINTIGVAVTTIDISGTKSWVAPEGTVLPEKVELTLFAQHGKNEATSVSAITITAADDWKYSFKDLPKYTTGSAIELITYTVEETPIAGYISNIIPTANGFDIVNTLFTKELGQLSVQKQVSGDGAPSADTEYNFVLQMKATQDMSEWDKTLEAKEQELLDAYNEAKAANGKANADLLKAEGEFMKSAFLTTTSSSYEFIMVDADGYAKLAAERVATPSHYIYEFNGSNTFKPGNDGTDESLIGAILGRIKSLFVEEDGYLYNETVLLTVEDEYEVTSPSALVFSMKHMNDVLDAYERVLFTEKLMETTSGSYLQFVDQELTTPTSLTLIVKDIDGKVVDTVEFDVNEALTDTNNFRYEFTLKHNQQLFFTMVATTGSQIVYNIVETSYTPEKLPLNSHECYQYTDIISMENGKETGTLEKVTTTGEYRDLTTGSVYGFVFCNVYDKEDTPPPGGGDYTPDPPKKPEPPKPPEEIIDDPEVPLDAPEVPEEPVVVPGEEIPEPEVPLGDAPATGDAANAVPFMVLMMFALCGLVVTRRKFN